MKKGIREASHRLMRHNKNAPDLLQHDLAPLQLEKKELDA